MSDIELLLSQNQVFSYLKIEQMKISNNPHKDD